VIMKGTAYSFAREVDRQIEELTRKDYLRRRGRGKLLREELYPISRLALHLKQPGLEIEVEAYEDDGPVDGHILESGFREREFDIEVTSDYSYDESLRDELLVEKGVAWGAGEIYRDKNSRKVVATCGVVDGDAHVDDVSKAVVRLFRNKASKSYPPNTILIISFDEIRLFGHYSWNQMLSRVGDEGGLSDSDFQAIYLFNIATNELHKAA
jgi:hypothetical protein